MLRLISEIDKNFLDFDFYPNQNPDGEKLFKRVFKNL